MNKKADSRPPAPVTPHASVVIQVAAGLIVHEGKYLIARRKQGTHLGGFWEFPGGKREPGESLTECLRRELREELGIEITEPTPFQVIRHDYPEKSVELHFFCCALDRAGSGKDRIVRAIGCEEYRWVAPEKLSGFDFPPADRPLLKAIRESGRVG